MHIPTYKMCAHGYIGMYGTLLCGTLYSAVTHRDERGKLEAYYYMYIYISNLGYVDALVPRQTKLTPLIFYSLI